jgi:hypothetical protein
MQSILRAQHETLQQIEGHAKNDKTLQVAQLNSLYKNLKDGDRTIDALEEINDSVKTQAKQNTAAVEEASRATKDNYYEFTKGRSDEGVVQQRGLMKMFDLSEGKSQGLLGRFVRNRVARNQFMRDEESIDPSARRSGLLEGQFDAKVKLMGKQETALKEVDRLRAAGRSEDDISKTGLIDTLNNLNERLGNLIISQPRLGTVDNVTDPMTSVVNATGAVDRANRNDNVVSIFSKTNQGLVGNTTGASDPLSSQQEEREVENLRMMEEQNEVIKELKDNSAYLPLIYEKLSGNGVTPEQTEGSGSGGGGLLGSIAGLLGARALMRRTPRVPAPRAPIPTTPRPVPGTPTATPRPVPTAAPGTPATAAPRPVPTAGGAAGAAPQGKWGRFLQFVQRKSPKLFAKVGTRLATAGGLAVVPVLGWVAAAISLGMSFWLAYDLYQLWKSFTNEDDGENAPTQAEPVKPVTGSDKINELRQQYQEADTAVQTAETNLAEFKEQSGPQVRLGTDALGDPIMGYEDEEKQAQYKELQRNETQARRSRRDVESQTKQLMDDVKGRDPQSDAKAIDALKRRYGYTDEQLQEFGGGATPENNITVDGKSYSPKVIGLYNELVKRDLQQPVQEAQAAAPGQEAEGVMVEESAPTPVSTRRGNTRNIRRPARAAPTSGDAVYSGSNDVAAAQQRPATMAPVVVNAPSSSSVNQTSNYAVPSPPRNSESSVKEYNRSRFR